MIVQELLKQVEKEKMVKVLKEHFGVMSEPKDIDQEKAEKLIHNFYITAIHEMVHLKAYMDYGHILCVIPYLNEWEENSSEFYQIEVYRKEDIRNYREGKREFPDFYGITFDDWKKILGMQIAEESLKRCGEYTVSAAILKEMTFFGCFYRQTREEQEKQMQELQNRVKELKDGRSETYSIEDVSKEVNIEPAETDLLEEEIRQKLLKKRIRENINRRKDFLRNLSA